MKKQTTDNMMRRKNDDPKKFSSVTSHLKSKSFKWLKEDMGFFDVPESWDPEFQNDNHGSHSSA